MPRGISLHVGINDYRLHFPGAATLMGCEKDAIAMDRIAEANGFKQRDLLLGLNANFITVTTKIRNAAAELENGDIFFFSFAGHGFRRVDQGNDGDEQDDSLDETLLLVDVEVLDDYLRKELWPGFRAGVRVLMVADSCHSGTLHLIPPEEEEKDEFSVGRGGPFRTISESTALRHRAEYGEFYRSMLVPLVSTIDASVLLLAACQDNEKTRDGVDNGVYTAAMLKVLESKVQDYDDLVNKITAELRAMGIKETPAINTAGPASDFRTQKPFKI